MQRTLVGQRRAGRKDTKAIGALAFCALFALCACDTSRPASTPARPAEPELGQLAQAAPRAQQPDALYEVGPFPVSAPPLAAGEGKELVEGYCIVCHSTGYISGQPPLPVASWQKTIDKMVQAYGATIPADVVPKIAAYLAAHYTEETRHLPARDTATPARGQAVYAQNCAVCHQLTGQGLPNVFPPLVGHAPRLVKKPSGRDYVAHLVLFGVVGEVEILGKTYRNVMPPLAKLDDSDLAAALNYVLNAWDNDKLLPSDFAPLTAAEITKARATPKTPAENLAARP